MADYGFSSFGGPQAVIPGGTLISPVTGLNLATTSAGSKTEEVKKPEENIVKTVMRTTPDQRARAGGRRSRVAPSLFLSEYLSKLEPTTSTPAQAVTSTTPAAQPQTSVAAARLGYSPSVQNPPKPTEDSTPSSPTTPAGISTTGYNPAFSDWSSASWGHGWASTPGGVARQLGLSGRSMGEFARFVNAQKRLAAEKETGYDYGYNPQYSVERMPSWIRELYATRGASGAAQATGKSGTGRYVDRAAYGGSRGAAAQRPAARNR